MEFMKPRARLDEVKEFCNAVRAAGGANPIDALMPSIPEEPEACLIARNLNFSCEVDANTTGDWEMKVGDPDTVVAIADALDLEIRYDDNEGYELIPVAVLLPPEIGQVAADFDNYYTDPELYAEFEPYIQEGYIRSWEELFGEDDDELWEEPDEEF